MSRVCPKCGNKLESSDNFFCSSCGEKLPDDLISTENNIRIRKYSPIAPAVSKEERKMNLKKLLFNKSMFMAVLLIVLILGSGFWIMKSGIFDLIAQIVGPNIPSNSTAVTLPIKPKTNHKVSLNLQLSPAEFESFDFAAHTPAEVMFFFEGTNLTDLVSLDIFSDEDENFSPKAKLLLEPYFAGFSYEAEGNIIWAYLFVPKDSKIAQDVFGNGWNDYWKIAFIDNYMVLTNNEEVFDKIKSVDDGIVASLAKNPDFVTKRKELDKSGQFQVFFMDKKAYALVRNSMGGLNQETIGMINMLIEKGNDALVITNNHE